MPGIAEHPTDDVIQAFALGKLEPSENQLVEQHLSECDPCQDRVEAVGPDTLVELLVAAHTRLDKERSSAPTPSFAMTQVWSGSAPESNLETEPPAVLATHPRYRVIRRLGVGGMGTVWLAEHTVMNRSVAIKVIRPELLARRGASDRFLREVRAAAKLHHPNIVTAFDAESVNDSCLLVMEYVPGETLADRVKLGPLPTEEACRVIRDAARGLAHAHAAGLVHRDVKPHNLIRAVDGTVKVLDFGLAGIRAGETIAATGDGLTGAGMVFGTPDYIAPEQIADPHTVDSRADIYSLGCTFYHLLSGHSPFPEGTIMDKLNSQQSRKPDSIPGLAGELAAVLAKMLAKRPEDRYQTAEEVLAALDGITSSVPAAQPAVRKSARRPVILNLSIDGWVLIAIVIALGVAVFKFYRDNQEFVIATDDPDIEVMMKRNGELVLIKDAKSGETWELDTVKNQIGLADKPDGLKIELPGKEPIILRRAGKEVFSVTRVQKRNKEQEPKAAMEISRDSLEGANNSPASIVQVAFSPDGRYFLAAGDAKISPMRIYDGKTGKMVNQFFGDNLEGWNGGAFSPDGTKVVSWSYGSNAVYVWESFTGLRLHKLVGHKEAINNAAFSPDGTLLVTGSQDHTLRIWDANTGKQKLLLEGHKDDCGGCFSPDGKWIVSAGGGEDSSARVWRSATGKEIWKQDGHGLSDFRLARSHLFSPDGMLFLSLNGSTIWVREISTSKIVASLEALTDFLGASFLPDGRQVATWGRDKVLRVWDITQWPGPRPALGFPAWHPGKELRTLDLGEDLKINDGMGVAISPDGRMFLTAHGKTVRVRDLATGKELHNYTIAAQEVRSMAFSPGSRSAAVGTSRSWVHLLRMPEPPQVPKP
jgi:WD40 repeat protein/tRNA A-37 threonylcarbamoyl transferase component Bud32